MENCEMNIEAISAMLDGELDARQETELRAHIEHCENCKKVYDAFTAISGTLDDDLAEPPDMLAKGIMFKIELREKGIKNRRFAFGRFTVIAACLAVILLGASRFGLLDGLSRNAAAPAAMCGEADGLSKETTDKSEASSEEYCLDNPEASSGDTNDRLQPKNQIPEGGAVYQFGGMPGDFSASDASQENSRMQDLLKKEISLLLLDAAEISIYKGEYTDGDGSIRTENLLLSISDKDTLKKLSKLLVFAASDESDITEQAPDFTLLIPRDDSSSDRMEDITVSIWFFDEHILCLDSKSDLLRLAEGSKKDFLELVESERKAQNIM